MRRALFGCIALLGILSALPGKMAGAQANAPPAAAETSSAGAVNIQSATEEELQRLPGIGPSKAQAIIAQRERSAFRRVEDIMRVRGIGRATFRRLRPMLSVAGPTTLTESPRARSHPRSEEDDDSEPQ